MGIAGGAALTPATGLISEIFSNIAIANLIPLFGYVAFALYAFKGSRVSLPATRAWGATIMGFEQPTLTMNSGRDTDREIGTPRCLLLHA